VTKEQMEWAFKACQRCLIYLGDIGELKMIIFLINYLIIKYYFCSARCAS